MLRKKTMAELARPTTAEFTASPRRPVSLLLDDIRSANNVGSLFRTADGFALRHLYLCGITAQPPHRDILKTALGATETIGWSYHANAVELLAELGREGARPRVQCLEQTHGSVRLVDYEPPAEGELILVVGNEVQGVSNGVLEVADGALEIEQFGTKHSLNVAVAAGIMLHHVSRKLRG